MTASIAVLERVLDAFNAHDLDAIMACFAEDCVLEMPRGPERWGARAEGKPAVRALLATRFTGLPDVKYAGLSHFVDGDMGISRWRITGTTPAGVRVDVHGCDFYRFREGEIISKDSYWKIREP